MRKKIWDFLTRFYTVTAVFINLALMFLAVEVHAFASDPATAGPLLVLLGGLLIFDLRLKKQHDRRQTFRLHETFIRSLLEAAASSILRATQAPVRHMRACLMLPDRNRDLRIRYCYGFEGIDLDRNIRVPIGTGCSGQAWVQGRAMAADLQEEAAGGMPDHWGLPVEEARKVRPSLKSILSVPIRAGEDYDIVAILTLDSDNAMADCKFVEESIQHISYCFAEVLSSLMNEVE